MRSDLNVYTESRAGPKFSHGFVDSAAETYLAYSLRTGTVPYVLFTKSSKAGAIPCYMGHARMENRHGLALDTRLTQATGTAEREAALAMLAAQPGAHGKTVGADKAYDHAAFVEGCRELGVTPHVAQNTSRRASRIDERTTRHPGYGLSQCIRRLIETLFADGKQHGVLRQVKLRGRERVDQVFTLAMTVANLRRLPRLIALHASG